MDPHHHHHVSEQFWRVHPPHSYNSIKNTWSDLQYMAKKNAGRLWPQRLYRHQVPQNINYVIWTLHHVSVCVQANFSTERWCPFIVPGKRATHASRKMLHAGKLRPFIVADCAAAWILVKFAPAGTLTEKATAHYTGDFFVLNWMTRFKLLVVCLHREPSRLKIGKCA